MKNNNKKVIKIPLIWLIVIVFAIAFLASHKTINNTQISIEKLHQM